jgi:hypothetical protein
MGVSKVRPAAPEAPQQTLPLRSLRVPLPLAFAATSNRLAPGAPLSMMTPLFARSQWNLGLPSAQGEGLGFAQALETVSRTVCHLHALRDPRICPF